MDSTTSPLFENELGRTMEDHLSDTTTTHENVASVEYSVDNRSAGNSFPSTKSFFASNPSSMDFTSTTDSTTEPAIPISNQVSTSADMNSANVTTTFDGSTLKATAAYSTTSGTTVCNNVIDH
jgi:hypothetical protein